MADITSEKVRELVERVLAEVGDEVKGQEKAFGVADLHTSVAGLAKVGGLSAWEISYKTTHASLERAQELARLGAKSAWEISYKTTSSVIEKDRTQGR